MAISERRNIKYIMWRKKVDASVFNGATGIPKIYESLWNIDLKFKGNTDRNSDLAKTTISFNEKTYSGAVTELPTSKRSNPQYRLWFKDEDLREELKLKYTMSYMRHVEESIRAKDKKNNERINTLEEEIPFFEFLDIEYDKAKNIFLFTSHYIQKTIFPELFKSLVSSPKVKEIDNYINKNDVNKILTFNDDWRDIESFQIEIGATNVIYFLINKKKRQFYIGEATNLISRFSSGKYNKNWDYYRYEKLPKNLENYRVIIEESYIRSFSKLLNQDVPFKFSNFKLINKLIKY